MDVIRKLAKRSSFLFALIIVQIISNSTSSAAGIVVFNAAVNTCGNFYQSSIIYGQRYIAGTTTNITAINVVENASAQASYSANFAASKYYVMADNGSSTPSIFIETLTADVLTPTSARYVGNVPVTAGTKYWIIPGQQFSVFPACYFWPAALPNSTVLTSNDWRLDTATSTTWGYISGATPTTMSTIGYASHLFAITIEVGAPTPVSISLNLVGGSNVAAYRTASIIRANLDTESKVTFYQSGKKIPGCIKVQSTSLVANCIWTPSVHGSVPIRVIAAPNSSSFSSTTSSILSISVTNRINTR